LNIKPDTRLQITPKTDSFDVELIDAGEDEALFVEAMEEVNSKYASVFQKLAE
jgi:hypothetical protein